MKYTEALEEALQGRWIRHEEFHSGIYFKINADGRLFNEERLLSVVPDLELIKCDKWEVEPEKPESVFIAKGLTIEKREDGYWLCIKTLSGKAQSININQFANGLGEILIDWANETFKGKTQECELKKAKPIIVYAACDDDGESYIYLDPPERNTGVWDETEKDGKYNGHYMRYLQDNAFPKDHYVEYELIEKKKQDIQ